MPVAPDFIDISASPEGFPTPPGALLDPPDVEGLMAWIRDHRERRLHSGTLHSDEAVEIALEQLASALASAHGRTPKFQALLGREETWKPLLHPRLQSHRGSLGKAIVWAKRYLIQPFIRWHIEYTEENVKRQTVVNKALLEMVGHLAAQVVRLEREVETLQKGKPPEGSL